jgi:hypothetical protein
MRLTTAKIQNTPPRRKTLRLFDGRGLYLEIAPTGSRWWRFKYRFACKEKRISLGVYPDVGLKNARDRRDEMRKPVADGIDPSAARKQEKLMALDAALNTFEAIAREWFEKHSPNWEASYSVKLLARLEANVFPWLGHRPIRDIKAPELLSVLRRVESRGVLETAHRLMNYCGNIYRYAVATGRAERDISADQGGALPPSTPRHHASVTEPQGVAALLRAIDGYRGSNVTRYALQLAPLVFVRPGEQPPSPPLIDPPGYSQHRPERTLLYQLVEQHYPALRELRAAADRPLPDFVQQEFDAYLKCGRLEEGFLRVRCEQCHAEKLVAFSCKKRGFCPSCGGRRMAETAALLADEVLPERPLRQWVLSLPHALRFLLATDPDALTLVLGVVYRTISRHLIGTSPRFREASRARAPDSPSPGEGEAGCLFRRDIRSRRTDRTTAHGSVGWAA